MKEQGLKKGIDFTGITVVYFCHDGEGNVLMSKRSDKCRDEQGTWDQGGGAVEYGDSVEVTIEREIREEYCTTVLDREFLGFRDVHRVLENGQATHWIALDFAVRIDRSLVANGEPHKLEEVAWFRLDALPSPMHSQFPIFLRKYETRLREILERRIY